MARPEWIDLSSAVLPPKECCGLYRIRACESEDAGLFCVGSGSVRDRLKPYRQQAAIECSWTIKPPCEQGYQEYIDDAIASYVLATARPPAWQFPQCGKNDVQ